MTASGEFASAEPILLESLDELDTLLGERHHECLNIIESLVELYDVWVDLKTPPAFESCWSADGCEEAFALLEI